MDYSEIRQLVEKIFLVLAPFVIVVCVGISLIKTPGQLQEESLNLKIQTLIINSPLHTDVIIGGDSRAERGVIPAVFEQQTGLRTVNTAVSAGTLQDGYAALRQHGLTNSHRLLIFSISIADINDGDITFLDKSLIENEPFGLQKINDMSTYYSFFFYYYYSHLKEFLRTGTTPNPDAVDAGVIADKGYFANTDMIQLPLPADTSDTDNNIAWYNGPHLDGIKWNSFVYTLKMLGSDNDTVVLYKAPLDPAWDATLPKSKIPEEEK